MYCICHISSNFNKRFTNVELKQKLINMSKHFLTSITYFKQFTTFSINTFFWNCHNLWNEGANLNYKKKSFFEEIFFIFFFYKNSRKKLILIFINLSTSQTNHALRDHMHSGNFSYITLSSIKKNQMWYFIDMDKEIEAFVKPKRSLIMVASSK